MTSQLDLGDKVIREALGRLTTESIGAYLGTEPYVDTHYASAPGWSPGAGRPVLVDDDPAVMQAIGRCAATRVKKALPMPIFPGIHPAPCGWCGYPLPELLAACSWSVWSSRLVLSETLTWTGANDSRYTRAGRHDVYENPVYARFWALPTRDREYRIQAATAASQDAA